MKLQFTQPELKWLAVALESVNLSIRKHDIDSGLARIVAKMRYKFAPNSAISHLNQKERAFLLEMLSHRQNHLIKQNSISEEAQIIQSLIEKCEA